MVVELAIGTIENCTGTVRFQTLEKLVLELRGHCLLAQLIKTPKFASALAARVDLQESLGDFNWFRATDHVILGLHNEIGIVGFTWWIVDHRIDDLW